MNNEVRVSIGYNGLTPTELVKFAKSIIDGVKGNTNFPKCTDYVADLIVARDQLETALKEQKAGDKSSTSAVHDAESEVQRVLRVIAATVEYESKNDATIALSSGFSLKSANGKITIQNLKVKTGKLSGTLDAIAPSYPRAAYTWYVTNDPIDTWVPVFATSTSKYTIKGLNPLKKYWIKVVVTQGEEVVFASDPIIAAVL